jgi:hypothetical protein
MVDDELSTWCALRSENTMESFSREHAIGLL